MNKHAIIPDGQCFYRSITCGLFYSFTHHIIGGGAPSEFTEHLDDIIANALTKLIKWMCVATLCSEKINYSMTTPISEEGYTLYASIKKANWYINKMGVNYYPTVHQKKIIIDSLIPSSFKKIKLTSTGNKVFEKNGMTATEIALSAGKKKHESWKKFFNRMLKKYSWGGESESYILAKSVLLLPIDVFVIGQKNDLIRKKYSYEAPLNIPYHRLCILWNGTNHYDSLLPRKETKTLSLFSYVNIHKMYS
jgi:hypothetical protein